MEKEANSDGDSSQLHSTPRMKKTASSTAETDGKELSLSDDRYKSYGWIVRQ